MSAFVYANGQYHCLAGNKIVKDAALLDMKATDKIIVNGQSYNLGAATTPAIPEVPDAPVLDDMVHNNGTEPSTGTKWYVTQDGAGSMNGTSWANAASQSQIHVILLSCASGDSVYFSEGDYTTDRTLTLPSGVSLFGGFPSENPTWASRDAFTHQTVWTASHSGAWLASTSNVSGQLVDGFAIMNYSGTTKDGGKLIFKNMTFSGGSFTTAGKLENCYVTGVTLNAGSVSSCKVVNSPSSIFNAESTDFYYANANIQTSAEFCNFYGTENKKISCQLYGTIKSCTVINCERSRDNGKSYIFSAGAESCTAINCDSSNSNGESLIFSYDAKSCIAINCKCNSHNGKSYIFSAGAESCIAINCDCISDGSPSGSHIFYGYTTGNTTIITNCKAINCSAGFIFSNESYNNSMIANSIAVNCSASRSIFWDSLSSSRSMKNCSAVNCKGTDYIFDNCDSIINCLSWNNSGTEFSDYTELTTCAGSTYNSALALTLGTDNSIARFTNTGFAPAKGVQDVGACPSPIDDPDGYAEWLSAFGDWHPAADSFLLGAGTADEDVTTDADGVTRPDPPSIGAYEAKPA